MVATLKDVALRAGVSIKTVSNVVNGYAHVTEEMRERVREALEELQYQPNLPARYLRKSRVGVLALAIPDFSNSYFSDIGSAVMKTASTRSYKVLVDHTDGDHAKELLVVNGLRLHLIDGIIFSPISLELEDLQFQKIEVPLVLIGERFLDAPYDHIAIENVAAACTATQHLIQLGRRRIAAIGAYPTLSGETGSMRLQGYMQALAEANQPFDPQLVMQTEFYHRIDGFRAMQQLLTLEQPPDAIFCFNDLMALGAMRALHEANYRVPEDVAVVGFDDVEDGRYATPSLTTIAPDKEKIGALAVSLLVERIEGKRVSKAQHVEVPFHLIIRESTIGRSAGK